MSSRSNPTAATWRLCGAIEILVEPAVGLRGVVVPLEVVRRAAEVRHPGDAASLDARDVGVVAELRRQPTLEQVRRLDDVVVDADDERDVLVGAHF